MDRKTTERSPANIKALAELLEDLFPSAEDMLVFVGYNYPSLRPSLSEQAGLRRLVFDFVQGLYSHGYVDKHLFESISRNREGRLPDIQATMDLVLASSVPSRSSTEQTSNPSSPAEDASFFDGASVPQTDLAADERILFRECLAMHAPTFLRNRRLDWSDIEVFSRVFEQISDCRRVEAWAEGQLIRTICQQIVQSTSISPLEILGESGSGKTTFLTLIYCGLGLMRREDTQRPIPFLINVHRYEELIYEGSERLESQVRTEFKRDIARFMRVVEGSPKQGVILILDGYDERSRFRDVILSEIERLEQRIEQKKIVSFRHGPKGPQAMPRWRPEASMTFKNLSPEDPRIQSFCEHFCTAASMSNGHDLPPPNLFVELKKYRLESVDVFTAKLLLDQASQGRDKSKRRLSELVRSSCESALRQSTGSTRDELTKAAELAFRHGIITSELPFHELRRSAQAWTLINEHKIIGDFLIAYHIVDQLVAFEPVPSAGGRSRKRTPIPVAFTFVYPYQISRFCKELMSVSVGREQQILNTLAFLVRKRITKKNLPCMTHAAYLMGRIQERKLQTHALEHLRKLKNRVVASLKGSGRADLKWVVQEERSRRELLMLLRTAYVSMAYLGDEAAIKEYIGRLIGEPVWDSLNRGFHLEYYGDIAYSPSIGLLNVDELRDWHYTYSRLLHKVRDRNGGRLFLLETYTLFSLAIHRENRSSLTNDQRRSLVELGSELLESNRTIRNSEVISRFLKMCVENLSHASFSVGKLAEDLYRLKTTKRAGWTKRGIQDGESVAEHSFGAYILGLLYLPQNAKDNTEYDKQRILNMVLVHDWAEAWIGDLLPAQKHPVHVEEERERFYYLEMCSVYHGVADLSSVRAWFTEFVEGATYNARVARDLDRLENLMQLKLYGRRYPGQIADEMVWEQTLHKLIFTEHGKALRDILVKRFGRVKAPNETG